MADVAVAVPVVAAPKVKKARKPASGKAKAADHPKYAQMIKDALGTLKERGGSSRVAILRYITKQYHLAGEEKIINSHLKLALRAGVKNGSLKQSKGMGAAGSFRLGEKVADKKPKKAAGAAKKSPKKPKVTPRKPKIAGTPKKAAKPKSVKAAKPKSAKKAASPKRAKMPKPVKAKSPKKAAKPKSAKAKASKDKESDEEVKGVRASKDFKCK